MRFITLDTTKRALPQGNTDWERLRSMTDAEAHAGALADSDNQPLTSVELARLVSQRKMGRRAVESKESMK